MSNTNYKLMADIITGNVQSVERTDASGVVTFIPFDNANKDYREYLEWVAEGNTPTPADS